MAALDDLLARIGDPQLREELAREIAPLRAEQELGLVFERHLPESARLYGHPVRRGLSVQLRADDAGPTWTVVNVANGQATVRRVVDGETVEEQHPAADLVVVRAFGEAIYPGLRSEGRVERGGDKPWHVAIKAENYHALEALLYTCQGKVDAIYIDPPYNTGAKDWKYNNDYVDDGDRNRHSKWLSFMEKRLQLAKRLLNPENSVLIVTIDEKEYLRLGLLLQQIFLGAHIQMVSALINPAAVARKGYFGRADEYVFFVMLGSAGVPPLPLADEWLTARGRTHRGEIRWDLLRKSGSSPTRQGHPETFYPFFIRADGTEIHSIGDEVDINVDRKSVPAPEGTLAVWPIRRNGSEGRWRLKPASARDLLEQGCLKLGQLNGENTPIYYLAEGERAKISSGLYEVVGRADDGSVITVMSDDVERVTVPGSQWRIPSHDATQYGTRLLQTLLPDRGFPFPKSLYAVEDALAFFVSDNPSALVLDFFAGSGTTAHAVARLNQRDGGQRRSIIVTNNEVSPEEGIELFEAGHLPGDPEWEARGIFNFITVPRVRAAFTGQDTTGALLAGAYGFGEEAPLADGFEENFEFFTLTYEDPDVVRAGAGFAAIAPLLWLKAGGQGPRIDTADGPWSLPEGARYGVLFNTDDWSGFTAAVNQAAQDGRVISHAFITTNSDATFTQVAADLPPETEPVRLYEDYLTSFAINTGGAS